MSEQTSIEWTDATWNPITGCSVVSAGCTNCYAMRLAGGRLRNHASRAGLTRVTGGRSVWTGAVRFNEQWLDQPIRWRRPRMVFVCAHGDLFHEAVPDEWMDRVFAVMALAPWHTFQVLTKRPERMHDYLTGNGRALRHRLNAAMTFISGGICRWNGPESLAHVWLGVSVEDQATADERIPILLDTPAAVRWVSAEPLLGPVNWSGALNDCKCGECDYCREVPYHPSRAVDWVVAGGESGPQARPSHPDWFRDLRDQCKAANVPFLFKQWGEYAPNWLNDENGKIPGSEWMDRFGKKRAGRMLDGVIHDEYPVSQ